MSTCQIFFFFLPLNSIVPFLASVLSISSHVLLLHHIELLLKLTAYSWHPPAPKLIFSSTQLFFRGSNASSSGIPATSVAMLSTQCLLSYIYIQCILMSSCFGLPSIRKQHHWKWRLFLRTDVLFFHENGKNADVRPSIYTFVVGIFKHFVFSTTQHTCS